MFGFGSTQTTTSTQSRPGNGQTALDEDDGDEGFVLSFDPYPAMSAPQPAVEWRNGEPEWATDVWGDEVVESDPQPGYDDQDYDDQNYDD